MDGGKTNQLKHGLSQYFLPDLVVNMCPLGCNEECARTWINENMQHKIICNCQCHKKVVSQDMTIQGIRRRIERQALAEDEDPIANSIGNELPFQERTPK